MKLRLRLASSLAGVVLFAVSCALHPSIPLASPLPQSRLTDPATATLQMGDLSSADSLALTTVAAVVQLFRRDGDAIWRGYDLARRPLIVYFPNRWAIFLNAPHPVEGFSEYPESWPKLDAPALVRRGSLGNLVGQLVFDLVIDSVKTAAIPLSVDFGGDRRGTIGNGFSFIVHEAFHQYQHDAFRSIPNDQPEEQYPILDSENTALASLEMHLLMDAVKASALADTNKTRELAEEFVAVRFKRWNRKPSFIPGFELPQELMEGTAKYVEVRYVGLMGDLCRNTKASSVQPPGCDVFGSVTTEAYLLSDFEDRLNEGVIEPPDMARNHMYPTASAIGVLLDFFGINWKARASDPATSPGLAEMLGNGLRVDAKHTDILFTLAQQRYGYDAMRAACDRLARAYPLEYQAAVKSLENEPGFHISIELPILGLTRSRSCQGKRWVLEQPSRAFSKKCQAYTLKHATKDDLFVEVHDSGVAEETNLEGTTRRATFVAPNVKVAELDGRPLDLNTNGTYRFGRVALAGDNFRIRYEGEGTLAIVGQRLIARLMPPLQ